MNKTRRRKHRARQRDRLRDERSTRRWVKQNISQKIVVIEVGCHQLKIGQIVHAGGFPFMVRAKEWSSADTSLAAVSL